MIAPDLDTAMARLQDMVQEASVILPFTGAGISTECGIPDFRSPGGIWTKNRPIPFDEFLASQEARNESWRRRFAMGDEFGHAKPGRGHRALASLYRPARCRRWSRRTSTICIKPLASRPNTSSSCTATRLTLCALIANERYEIAWVRQRMESGNGCAPDCPSCGGHIKTATVSFGQAMPDSAMRRAQDLTLCCDLFLAIGSSLVVWPAAGFPLMAKRNGARLIIINREPTDFDDIADLVVRQDIGTVLAPFVDCASSTDVHRL